MPCVLAGPSLLAAGPMQLLYAVPIALDRLPEVLELNRQGTRVQVLIDTHTAAEFTDAAARAAGQRLGVFLKLDCGYG